MIKVVLTDANILYSRVLRDYLVYAAADSLIRLRWSETILEEMSRNLIGQFGMSADQVQRLRQALNRFLPEALVVPSAKDYAGLSDLTMPDEDDRHVVAAAVSARANVLCTQNVKDFPPAVMERVSIHLQTPSEVLEALIRVTPHSILAVHRQILTNRRNATTNSLIDALHRSGAIKPAQALSELLAKNPAIEP